MTFEQSGANSEFLRPFVAGSGECAAMNYLDGDSE